MDITKLLSIISLMILLVSCKNIEDVHKNEYSVSIGLRGPYFFISECELGETSESTNMHCSNNMVVSGSFEHQLNNWLYVGMSASFYQRKYEVWEADICPGLFGGTIIYDEYQHLGNNKAYNLSFLPTMKFNWLRKKYFTMYSRLSAGCTYRHENMRMLEGVDSFLKDQTLGKTSFMYQISPLGLEVGSPHFRLFAELGWGATAVQSGLRIRY